jgi:uncharacterized protein
MKTLHHALAVAFLFLGVVSAQAQQFEVMVYTSPDRWHDPVVPIAMQEFQEMALKHDFELTWTQSAGRAGVTDPFSDAFLERMDVVVFLNARGYELSPEQRASFKRFINNGGGFVGIHAASANRDQEEWFRRLVGRVLTDHPEEQTAVMRVLDKNFPATMHLPDSWIWTDEWYSYGEELSDGLNYLITVDETTYDPDRTWGDPNRFTAMGDFHPISWYQEYEGGRSFYTTLGHIPATFKDPWFLGHIYGGIYWAATGLGIAKDE